MGDVISILEIKEISMAGIQKTFMAQDHIYENTCQKYTKTEIFKTYLDIEKNLTLKMSLNVYKILP